MYYGKLGIMFEPSNTYNSLEACMICILFRFLHSRAHRKMASAQCTNGREPECRYHTTVNTPSTETNLTNLRAL